MPKNICLKCKKEVRENDHQVLIATLKRPNNKKDDYAYFHFSCWVDFFRDSVNNKSRADVEKMRIMAVGLLDNPMVRGVVEKIGAGDQLQAMLGTPLIKPQVVQIVTKKDIEKKIKNDRKRETKTNKTPKVQ
jgi:hypothetical protein